MSIYQNAHNKINIKNIAEEGAVDVNLIRRQEKVERFTIYMQIKRDNKELKNEEICKAMGISASTMCRIRKYLGVASPYRYDIPTKKSKPKSEPAKVSAELEHPQPKVEVSKTKPMGRPKKKNDVKNMPLDIGGEVDPSLMENIDALIKNVK